MKHPWVALVVTWLVMIAASMTALTLRSPRPSMAAQLVATPIPAPSTPDCQSIYGIASWYGRPFHGHLTASGIHFDMSGYSCAHRTLPLGTFVYIVNLDNGRRCVAVVNDRGPYVEGRDWDVSAAVAGRLGMVYRGIAHVKVRVIE